MGCEDLIEYDDKVKEHYLTCEAEENLESSHHIEEFEDNVFWEELITNLTSRDLEKIDLSKLASEAKISTIVETESKWKKEFQQHGLDRLDIVE